MLAYTAAMFRGALLRPATPGDIPAQTARGAVTAYIVLLCVVAVIFTIDHPEIAWRKRLRSPYFLLLIVGSALLYFWEAGSMWRRSWSCSRFIKAVFVNGLG